MKSIKTSHILLFLSIIHFGYAQITPIETEVDTKKTAYYTSSYSQNILTFKNQSYNLKQKLQENVKISDNTSNPLFVKDCLNESTYTSLRNSKIRFSIDFVCNQDGNILSSSLINHGNKVSLSDSEVECILTEALNNTFSFNNVPSDVNNFYYVVRKLVRFK